MGRRDRQVGKRLNVRRALLLLLVFASTGAASGCTALSPSISVEVRDGDGSFPVVRVDIVDQSNALGWP
jgi:hypothetical protein